MLYPFVCSTAAKTEMTLTVQRRDFVNLQDRCRDVIGKRIRKISFLKDLHLPHSIIDYLAEAVIEDPERLFQPVHIQRMSITDF